ncbi:metal ABC transporter ATP-binding protein [Carnobacteriaceae bacterium zg-ZUI240]|nr:metal ABC transporter ATP-binding protein [Carnobacteriaceae bacterium zg-ZUI240]
MQESVITLDGVSLEYGSVVALSDVHLAIPKGSRTVVLGPNGAGKSSLVKAILQLEKIKCGKITLNGKPISLKQISQKVAYVPQSSNTNVQFPATIFDIVLMGRFAFSTHFLKRPTQEDKQIALNALERMQLLELKDRHITQLSGGQKQRVLIARAIAQQADIYILDEPLAGVDVVSEQLIMETLKQFQQEGKTSITIHHDLNTVQKYFDHVVWINQTVIADGSLEDVFNAQLYQQTYHISTDTIFFNEG